MPEAHFSMMQIITLKVTTQGRSWVYFVQNCLTFPSIIYQIFPYA